MGYYILDENDIPIEVDDGIEWARWFEKNRNKKRVASTHVTPEIWVSTVFLGLDHQYGDGPPLIYETMVFNKDDGGGDMRRYSTRSEAMIGHIKAVDEVRARMAEQGRREGLKTP